MTLIDRKHHMRIEEGELRGEINTDTPSLVDVKGYMPLAKQVERAILAGERLEAFRRGEFDSMDEDFYGEPSPLQDPDFMPSTDMEAVATANSEKLKNQIEAQLKTAKEQSVEKNQNITDSSISNNNSASADSNKEA